MPDDAHYFIGIDVPDEYKEFLSKWQESLEPFVDYRKWVNMDDFHVTFRFLGGLANQELAQLKNKLTNLVGKPFQVEVKGIDFFGKEDQPRVMYAEVERNEAIFDLKQSVDDLLLDLGIEPEKRPYRPHITLAKKWRKGKLQIPKDVLERKILEQHHEFDFHISSIQLFQVHPDRVKKYEVIDTFSLE
ncbi:RNA 2',3'-cyclic phosphodiesterase [Aquisalibacillus elongatus]|uniref:RNA 2',3'-cyclic phosphodiesterase n=1 Tax=Aquisalibacillus elongatus TaxID=485577 RepID=A0A3N5BJ41_9BACI|nr:RNA 2',3'-cyclic phosphodiesterase [Aquisalibacillus elongatus]RPF55300.1 2'-5' RNA ligase [Aquisalibacillus elongatus]